MFLFLFSLVFLPLNIPLPACSCTCLLSGPPVCLGLPLQSPLLPLIPPARDVLTPFPLTVPRATATPTPNTFPAEPRAPSIASDVLPGAKPSRLSLWGPWAGPGPILSPTSTESPLHEKPLPPEPPTTPGTTVPAPADLGPLTTPEDLLASYPFPSDAAAVSPTEPGPETLPSMVALDQPPGTAPATLFPGATGSMKPVLDWLTKGGGELLEAEEWMGGDTPAFSTSTLLSGDGDSAEHEGPPAPLILLSSLDYQYDTPGLWELVRSSPGRRPREGRGRHSHLLTLGFSFGRVRTVLPWSQARQRTEAVRVGATDASPLVPAGRGESEGELLPLCGERPRLLADTGPREAGSPASRQEPVALPGMFAYPANNFPFKLLGYSTESAQVLESRKKPSPAPAFSPDLGCTVAGPVLQPT